MLTISPLKTGLYQPKQNTAINKQQQIPVRPNKTAGNFCYPAVYFLGHIDKTQRPPFKDSTLKRFDTVYQQYQDKLNEISKEDINSTIDKIANTTEYNKKDITEAMQLVTQFGNMQSVNIIGKTLENHEAGRIPNNGSVFKFFVKDKSFNEAFSDNFGLNAGMHYLLNQKELYEIEPYNFGIFLDDNKLQDIEKLKEKSPEALNDLKTWKNARFFVLSGYENGISFIDRSKSLESATLDLLNKAKEYNIPLSQAVDKDVLDRCDKLGIKPIIIKNENTPSVDNIYKQLRPEQISEQELNAVIDASVMKKIDNPKKQIDAKDGLVTYLENSLENYTPERMSKELKEIHSKIIETTKNLGKTPEDIIYIIPNDQKSYDLVDYQYQEINNIPKDKFVTLKSPFSFDKLNPENKVLVLLDDCSLSGSSFLEEPNFEYTMTSIRAKQNNNNIIFAALYASDFAEEKIDRAIHKRKRQNHDIIIKNNNDENNWHDNMEKPLMKLTKEALGNSGWEASRYCLIFPYMAPDNNSEFAANIALFHNVNYRLNNNHMDSRLFALSNIKTLYKSPKEIANLTEELLAGNN